MTMPKKKSSNRWWLRIILALIVGMLLFFVYLVLTIPQLPSDLSQLSLNAATSFYNENGEVISSLGDRQMVPISQISPYFLKAIVAVEDDRFYQHHGLSKRGLIRAFVKNVRHMRIVEGGSSITQQLAKNLFLSFEQTYGRKFQEMLLALHIERTFTKDQILEAYCNQICFGPGIYGIEIAAQNYLGKHADELNLAEAAFLTNLPRSPYYYNPYKNYELARKRQGIVLGRLLKTGQISPEEQQAALEIPLNLKRLNQNYGQANYAISAAQNMVAEKYGRDVVNYGGLKIHTTINSRLQQYANLAVKNGMNALDHKLGLPDYDAATATERSNYPQIALVAIEPKTGKIRALVGGRNYAASEFNRALSNNRLPGSSFKPLVYLTALDEGVLHPASVMEDRPVTFGRGEGSWSPTNFSKRYHGSIILKKALMNSINIVAAKTIAEVGPNKVIKTARKLGISGELNNDLTLALGTAGVSPVEMAAAYATFANSGIHFDPLLVKRVESNDGQTLFENPVSSQRAFDAQSIYLLLDMMQGVFEDGTARSAKMLGFNRPAAGKTGTTNDYRDAWFVGFTPQLVTAVWVGYDDNRPMRSKQGRGITGASGALPIWTEFMKNALQNQRFENFPIPSGIIFRDVDPGTGEVVPSGTFGSMRVALRYDTELSRQDSSILPVEE